MISIKSPLTAILGLSLVLSTLPIQVKAAPAPDAGKRARVIHVEMAEGDGSCDEPVERVVLPGSFVDPRDMFMADPEDDDDDEDQSDEIGGAPAAVDEGLAHRHDPPSGNGIRFFDMVVRGKKTLLAVFSRAGPPQEPGPEAECSGASLHLQAFRTAAPGRRFEVESGRPPADLRTTIPASSPLPFPTFPQDTGGADRRPLIPPARDRIRAPATR